MISGSSSKQPQKVRTYRIAVLGPSFVGKTQLINRFINNCFSPYYDPTLHANVYKKAFSLIDNDQGQEQSQDGGIGGGGGPGSQLSPYVNVEIIDVFPHDHPALNEEVDLATPSQEENQFSNLAAEMNVLLNALVKNDLKGHFGVPKKNPLADTLLWKIHGYIYVYDASNKNTFQTLSSLIETIKEIEKSERRGQKIVVYTPKKLVLGNKKDLVSRSLGESNKVDRESLQKLEVNKHRLVSALTNQGVQESFRTLITDIHSCNILNKEMLDLDKKMNEGNTGSSGAAQGNDARASIVMGGRRQASNGFFSNFLGCASARDDFKGTADNDSDDDELQEGEEEEDTEEAKQRKKKKRRKQQTQANAAGGCNLF